MGIKGRLSEWPSAKSSVIAVFNDLTLQWIYMYEMCSFPCEFLITPVAALCYVALIYFKFNGFFQ